MKTQDILFLAGGFAAGYFIFGGKTESMGSTIREAENNDRGIQILPSGYGHWEVTADYRGKRVTIVTTDSMAIDDFKSEFGEKDGRVNRRKRGYEKLMWYISRSQQ